MSKKKNRKNKKLNGYQLKQQKLNHKIQNEERIPRLLNELDNVLYGKANLNLLSQQHGLKFTKDDNGKSWVTFVRPEIQKIDSKIFWNNDKNVEVSEEIRILSLFLLMLDILRYSNNNPLKKHNGRFSNWIKNGEVQLYRGVSRTKRKSKSFDLTAEF